MSNQYYQSYKEYLMNIEGTCSFADCLQLVMKRRVLVLYIEFCWTRIVKLCEVEVSGTFII